MPIARNMAVSALLLFTLTATVAVAQEQATPDTGERVAGEIVDKVVATVDDEVVLLSDVLNSVQIYLMQARINPGREEFEALMAEALENMITEKMLVAKARRDEIQVGDHEVEESLDLHIENMIRQSGGEERFLQQLAAQGMTKRDLRSRFRDPIRDQLLARNLSERVTTSIMISDDDARAFYSENIGDADLIPLRPAILHLAHILVLPHADPELLTVAHATLASASSRLDAGEDFAAVASDLSQGPAAESGGDLGWFDLAELNLPRVRETLVSMAPGDISEAVESEQGLHILQMTDRVGGRVRFSQIFLPLAITEANRATARGQAKIAHRRLSQGEEWDAIVSAFSEDELTRGSGGRLPAIPAEQLDNVYLSMVDVLDPGEFSGVFQGSSGYQILRLIEREEARPYEYGEIAERIRSELRMREQEKALMTYASSLEGEIVVVRKGLPAADELVGQR